MRNVPPCRLRAVGTVVGAIFVVGGWNSPAAGIYTYRPVSVREHAARAAQIVVAEPVDDPQYARRFHVIEVIAGGAYTPGEVIDVEAYALSGTPPKPAPGWVYFHSASPVAQAVLFIYPPRDDDRHVKNPPTLAAVRAVGKSGELLVPRPGLNSSEERLEPSNDFTWPDLLAKIRADAAEIARVRSLRAIADPGERNQELFRWIDEHRHEFGSRVREIDRSPTWGGLEEDVLLSIMESCIAEDCWRAAMVRIDVHKKLNIRRQNGFLHHGIRFGAPSFCTREGRSLLMARAGDGDLGDDVRLTALRELVAADTLYYDVYGEKLNYPTTSSVSREEQASLLELLRPLLDDPRPIWRITAAVGLGNLGHRERMRHRTEPQMERALRRLRELFETEADESVFKAVADAINQIENGRSATVMKHEGSPLCVLVTFVEMSDREFRLKVTYRSPKAIQELNRFELERVGPPSGGRGAKLLIEKAAASEASGGRRGGSTIVTLPRVALVPGKWILHGVGRVEKQFDGNEWRASAAQIAVPGRVEENDVADAI